MPSPRKVTLRAQWLGKMLKELREQNQMTLREAAEYIQRDLSALSRFESGVHPIRRGDVYALMDLYGVEDTSQRDILLQLTGEVAKTGWWEKYSHELSWGIMDYLWLESRAERIRTFDVTRINGLLQLPEYAEAWIRAVEPDNSEWEVARAVEVRMTRQEILDGESAAQFVSILDESALRRPVGGVTTMKSQLYHLLDRAQRENIEVRVLPTSVGEHGSPDGGFGLIKMADPFPTIACADSPAGSLYVEMQDAERLIDVYDRLYDAALTPEDSASLIESVEKELT